MPFQPTSPSLSSCNSLSSGSVGSATSSQQPLTTEPTMAGCDLQHAEIQQLKQQLEQAQRMATLGELTGTATHEFNNLLMTILNYAKLGLRHKDDASRDKALNRIHDAAVRASKLTGSILSLARNRTGDMEPTDLKAVIEDTVLLLEREFRKYRIDLELHLAEVAPILGQGNELQRVLINMLVNARQATGEGGTVRVGLKDCPDTNEVAIIIRDTGAGIPADVLPKIFDPYFSTKAGPDASGKGGSGVGLACCKKIIDTHRGRIRVETAVGKGTAFTIRLPKAKTLS